jgi:tetratricopeptide (TPR) repeat protein
MKTLFILILLFYFGHSFAQNKKTISYRQWQDMPQDTYVRIMKTADSLLADYQYERFNFERNDGKCCLKGLLVIKEFYSRALLEEPKDEDALLKLQEVEGLIEDEHLLYEEKQFGKILKKGDEYYKRGFYKKAYALYQRAAELNPTSKSIKKKLKLTKKRIKKFANI